MPTLADQAKSTVVAKTKDAALTALGIPVVIFDRVSVELNTRLDLDSYVDLARDHAGRSMRVWSKQVDEVNDRVRVAVTPFVVTGAKLVEPLIERATKLVPDSVEAEFARRATEAKHFVESLTDQILPGRSVPFGVACTRAEPAATVTTEPIRPAPRPKPSAPAPRAKRAPVASARPARSTKPAAKSRAK